MPEPTPDYQVLARRWRPQTFDDVIGQEHVTRTLQNAIRSGRIGHAYLFVGSRGIGKTTTARVLAKALNCLSSGQPTPAPCDECANCRSIAAGNNIDVLEIDGASNNSVDDVRQIRENVRMVPASSRYKIYVIDEVHQLSLPAFNALLKTLEEPPPHAVFILATTEAHKIPATIVSRCQRYDFRRAGVESLMGLLRKILDAEGMRCSDDALRAIAYGADGGIRDAESILDQLITYCDAEITFQDVYDVLGLVDWRLLHALCDAIAGKDVSTILGIVDDVVVAGNDLTQFVEEVLRYFRNLLVAKTGAAAELTGLPDAEIAALQERAERYTLTQIIKLIEQFAELNRSDGGQLSQRTALEALLIRIALRSVDVSVDSVLEKLALLGAGAPGTPTKTPDGSGKRRTPRRPAKPEAAAEADANTRPEARTPATRDRERDDLTSGDRPAEMNAAISDPHVAKVVDVFKGKVVHVRPVEPPSQTVSDS